MSRFDNFCASIKWIQKMEEENQTTIRVRSAQNATNSTKKARSRNLNGKTLQIFFAALREINLFGTCHSGVAVSGIQLL